MEHLTILQQGLAVLSGVIVGFSLGLIGGGGSILAVPLLLYLVGYHNAHVVIGTTALAVSATAYFNLLPHARAGHVRWRTAVVFAVSGVVGAAAGSTAGKLVSGQRLLFLFALVMIAVSLAMLRPQKISKGQKEQLDFGTVGKLVGVGLAAGVLSGFFGIGGGFIIVPGLVLSTGMPMIYAIGSSLFSVGTFGLTTAVNYALSGLVSWPVVVEYLAGGMLGGWTGAMLAGKLGERKRALNYLYSGVIFLVALYMIYRNIQAVGL